MGTGAGGAVAVIPEAFYPEMFHLVSCLTVAIERPSFRFSEEIKS